MAKGEEGGMGEGKRGWGTNKGDKGVKRTFWHDVALDMITPPFFSPPSLCCGCRLPSSWVILTTDRQGRNHEFKLPEKWGQGTCDKRLVTSLKSLHNFILELCSFSAPASLRMNYRDTRVSVTGSAGDGYSSVSRICSGRDNKFYGRGFFPQGEIWASSSRSVRLRCFPSSYAAMYVAWWKWLDELATHPRGGERQKNRKIKGEKN